MASTCSNPTNERTTCERASERGSALQCIPQFTIVITIIVVISRLISLLTVFISLLIVLTSLLTGCKFATLLQVRYPNYKKIIGVQSITRLISIVKILTRTVWKLTGLVVTTPIHRPLGVWCVGVNVSPPLPLR